MNTYFFDPIFSDGVFSESRIEQAGTRILKLTEDKQLSEAESAANFLGRMLLAAIADGRVTNPKDCAARYYSVVNAALERPTLLDQVKQRTEDQQE